MQLIHLLEDHDLYEIMSSMESNEIKLQKVNAFIDQLKKRQLVCGYDIVSLESFHKEALSKKPLASYTEGYSKTNLTYTIEASERLATALRVGLVVGFATFLANFILWAIAGRHAPKSGGGGMGNLDPLAETRAMLQGHALRERQLSAMIQERFDMLRDSLDDGNTFNYVTGYILANVKESADVFADNTLGGLTLASSFQVIISTYVAKGKKPLILNLFKHDSKDTLMISKARDLIIFGFENLHKDLQKLKEAFHEGKAPEHLTDPKLFVDKLKSVADACGVKGSDNVAEMTTAINQHIQTGLQTLSDSTPSPVTWKELSSDAFANIMIPIKDMTHVEESIHDHSASIQEDSKEFLETVEKSGQASGEKLLYEDAIKAMRSHILAFGVLLQGMRSIQRNLRYLELCINRSILKLIRILKDSVEKIKKNLRLQMM